VVSRALECGELPSSLKSFRGQPAWLAKRLYNEFRSGDAVSPLVIEGLVLEMVGEICRRRPEPRSFGPQRKVSQAREFLDAAFARSVSLGDVAEAVNLHPVYLARMFRQTYRCSVGEYVRRRRVDSVCSQLSASDKPLAEIASEAGFCDQAHLTRTFSKQSGLTPSQYRRTRR
jgi:AraC family transcriptional regulator